MKKIRIEGVDYEGPFHTGSRARYRWVWEGLPAGGAGGGATPLNWGEGVAERGARR